MTLATPPHAGGATAPQPAGDGRSLRRRFTVRGVVQGVGFRPFVWTLASRLSLTGTVRNTSGAVLIEVQGPHAALVAFGSALRAEAPRLARIDAVETDDVEIGGDSEFRIVESQAIAGEYQPIAPDAATCPECVADIFDPANRRHCYPFTNCTNCGPRFTIIEDVPYDRALTTMRAFTMCSACRREYDDPSDRRFHAQPNACPQCGPRLWFSTHDGTELAADAIELATLALGRGDVIALKGLGGFQLCCDATDEAAVRRLRERKRRPQKPFAVMCADLEDVRELCEVSADEAATLTGTARPVVLLRLRRDGLRRTPPPSVAPGLHELGVMLPYTPLHHLLLRSCGGPLVMTSGNVTEEPIAKDNEEGIARLGSIADGFLLHDRDIYARYDDSVVRLLDGSERVIRRARGYCPLPVRIGGSAQVLALGGHLKNTFCLLRGGNAFAGPHIGDLDNPKTLEHHHEALETYLRLFRAEPSVVAADLHPDYASTRLAEQWWDRGARPVRIQHHHAHIASVMAEHGLRGQVIGVAFDGVGYGPDGSIWGGELLLCDERTFVRAGHLTPVRQPGGDAAAHEGWRMAIAYLAAAGTLPGTPGDVLSGPGVPDERRWRLVSRVALSAGAPISTSAGRLFDAVASLLDVAHLSTFEAEAAMRLEALAAAIDPAQIESLPAALVPADAADAPLVLDTVGLVSGLLEERRRGRPAAELAAAFHESLAQMVAAACLELSRRRSVRRVALSGGVFQNALLSSRLERLLRERDLDVYSNQQIPANDGGISVGQALIAAALDSEHGLP
ncbi:MAG: carbamoyltransferase HypF [Candidatus Dormibacteria bacterium]